MKFTLFNREASAPAERSARGKTAPAQSTFHAVDIVSNGVCCKAAQHLAGTRFLSRERPPQLPLGNCDFPAACSCRYRHHEDRRKNLRRQSDNAWSSAGALPPERERRIQQTGRRDTDR